MPTRSSGSASAPQQTPDNRRDAKSHAQEGGGRYPVVGVVMRWTLLGVGLLLCLLMTAPFLAALFWALVLAILAYPLDDRVRQVAPSPSVSAGVSVALTAAVVIILSLFVARSLLLEAIRGAEVLSTVLGQRSWPRLPEQLPWLSSSVAWLEQRYRLEEIGPSLAAAASSWGAVLLEGSFKGAVSFILTFYFLFYLLRDRASLRRTFETYGPFSDGELDLLWARTVGAVHASVYGLLAVSLLQGVLGGVMFWLLGLPAPVFWGVLMAILGMIPLLGAFVVWVPAAIYLLAEGHIVSSLVLVGWGVLVVGLADNLVYPVLVGRQLMMHSAVSFIAVIGGLYVFGAVGLVMGPVAVALSHCLLDIYRASR